MRDPARVVLPPPSLLDDSSVHEAVESWQAAASQHEQLRRDRYDLEQRGLPEAIEADRRAGVAALEQGKALPKPKAAAETKVREVIDGLVRREQSAETIKAKAHAALLEVLEAGQPKLAESAAKRREAALADYRVATDKLDDAVTALAEASALVDWAAEPTAKMWKVRGLLTAIIGPNGDRLAVPALVDQLRTVGQPPPKPTIPSPFPALVEEPEGEPEPAAGSPAA
jgi:hypothetical protein